MIRQPRPIHFRTIYDTAKLWPYLFSSVPTSLTFFLLAFPFSLWLTFDLSKGAPNVDYEAIMQNGISAMATVTDVETVNNVTINGRHPVIISYNYLVDGKDVQSRFRTLDQGGDLLKGEQIEIKYLDGDSIIPAYEQHDPFLTFAIMPAMFFLFGVVPTLILGYRVRKRIRLYKHGTITTAQVLSVTQEASPRFQLFFKYPPVTVLDYQYSAPSGKTYVDSERSNDLTLANTWKQGDAIMILVSPEDESKSTLLPKREAVRNNWKIDQS